MWTPATRRQHSRLELRYGSDLTDAEWLILSPFLPANATCGRKRAWPMREVINAICYVLRGGIAWRLLPDGFPPWSTVYRWFARLRHDGIWQTINHHLVMRDRERAGREASPTAAVVDSQSVKTTESGGVRGYDAGKKIKGRKRHAMVDTDGRALKLHVHGADIQDRDGAGPLLRASRPYWPFVQLVFADSGYQGPRVGLPFTPGDGSSSASSPGSTAIAGWQRTSKPPSHPPKPSSTPLPLSCCYADWHVDKPIRNRLLPLIVSAQPSRFAVGSVCG
jgi:transposase